VPDEAATEALLEEIAELYAIVLRIARRVHEGDEPMTATQRLARVEIAAAGPMRLRDLVLRMDTTPATATRAVDALEELRFVSRKPDPDDRRGVIVYATARGRRWSDKRQGVLREVLADLPDAAASRRFVKDLSKLNASLRTVSGIHDASGRPLLRP
jgi:DNA-binding MarR family transcriptional regulator